MRRRTLGGLPSATFARPYLDDTAIICPSPLNVMVSMAVVRFITARTGARLTALCMLCTLREPDPCPTPCPAPAQPPDPPLSYTLTTPESDPTPKCPPLRGKRILPAMLSEIWAFPRQRKFRKFGRILGGLWIIFADFRRIWAESGAFGNFRVDSRGFGRIMRNS